MGILQKLTRGLALAAILSMTVWGLGCSQPSGTDGGGATSPTGNGTTPDDAAGSSTGGGTSVPDMPEDGSGATEGESS